jgi:hypothetical protein
MKQARRQVVIGNKFFRCVAQCSGQYRRAVRVVDDVKVYADNNKEKSSSFRFQHIQTDNISVNPLAINTL